MVRLLLLCLLGATSAAADIAALMRPGAVALMRHATAPGTGDPATFRLGDCATQRNLSAAGRDEVRAVGAALRAGGVTFTHVLTSEWCRTIETADLLALGPVTAFPPLNSFFADRRTADRQTRETLAALAALPPGSRAILVTHQVNITALTGLVPRSGEIVVAEPDGQGGLRVTFRLSPR